MKVLAALISSEDLTPWLVDGPMSSHDLIPMYVCILIATFLKDTSHINLGLPTCMTSFYFSHCFKGFSGGSDSEEFTCNAGDLGLIPGSRRSPGEGNGYPLQYSCLENPMDRGAWWAIGHGVTKSGT